jgi:palmitoyltransferase
MDHHCPWVSQCVGHRTHAAFLHLLLCVTLLALYIGINAGLILYDFVFAPVAQPVMDSTPLHCLFLVIMGFIFSMVIGSFFGFHVYLSFTNQTTLEQLSPFHLLKYLPKPKAPRRAPGIGTSLPGIATRNIPVPEVSGLAPTDESPYYFPSPPATPPPAPEAIDALRHALLASNPFSTIPPSAPDTPTDLTPGRVFSSSPVATTHPHNTLPVLHTSADAHSSAAGHAEWDEDSLSFAQRRLVRRTADRLGLWDLGWRRNVIAVLGSGDTSTRRRGRSRDDEGGTSLAGSGSTSRLRGGGVRRVAGRGHPKAYGWRWWFSVLLNGGPPRGDGRTFPRNPKARGMLEELRRGLEEEERGETRRPVDFRAAAGGPRSGRRGHDEGTELRGI